MRLLSYSKFDITSYYGNLVILYPEGMEAEVKPILSALDNHGYAYLAHSVGPTLVMQGKALLEITELLDTCTCLVPVLSSAICSPEGDITKGMFWYFIGYVRARVKDAIVPYIPPTQRCELKGTPIQTCNFITTPGELIDTIADNFSGKLLRNRYYEDNVTNLYAARRIDYHCLCLCFDIYEAAFQNAKRYYADSVDEDVPDSVFDTYIECALNVGCKILSFGVESRMEPQMMVYRDEVHPVPSKEPRSRMGRRSYRRLPDDEAEKTGIRARLYVDVLVPVHKILGVYLKAYFEWQESGLGISMPLALLEPDFMGGKVSEYSYGSFASLDFWRGVYQKEAVIHSDRVYFTLNKKPDNPLCIDAALGLGETLDYVYPQ